MVGASCAVKRAASRSDFRTAGAQFMAFGFAGSSMQGIAKAAGISRASLYTYFGSKEEVFHAVIKLFEWNIALSAQRAVEELGPAHRSSRA